LQARTTLIRHAASSQRDARLREIGDGNQDVRAAPLELVLHAGLIELVGHLANALERNATECGRPLWLTGPAGQPENHRRGNDADDGDDDSATAADAADQGLNDRRHLSGIAQLCMLITVRYASANLLRNSINIWSESCASSVAAITWCSSTFSPRMNFPT